jgi:acyl-CoA thioesterase-2
LNDDPNLHRCALTYISDMAAVEPGMRGAGVKPGDPDVQVASLEHAVWFHRPFRCDEWLLFECECVSLSAGRGLNRGYVYSRTGDLIASLMQETMLRQRDAIAVV